MWWILWATWNIVILVFTVLPLENFVGHAHWDNVRWIPLYDHPSVLFDIAANVALFVPFGYLLKRALSGRSGRQTWILTFLLAGGISTGVEFYQVYCHNRFPSTTDIGSNLLGAIIGVLLSETVRKIHAWRCNRRSLGTRAATAEAW